MSSASTVTKRMVKRKSEPGLHDSSPNLPSPSRLGITIEESGRKERLKSAKHKRKEHD